MSLMTLSKSAPQHIPNLRGKGRVCDNGQGLYIDVAYTEMGHGQTVEHDRSCGPGKVDVENSKRSGFC